MDKGFGNFMKVVNKLAEMYPDLEIEVKLVAWYGSVKDRVECEPLIHNENSNITIYFTGKQSFTDFTGQINETDIFLDLRSGSFENDRSLPIRLFYYAALGRPVIFSDLKAVRHDVEIEKFGFLTDPGNTEGTILLISEYLKDPDLYKRHCENARNLAIEKYNWGKISPRFRSFIKSVGV
jgi:glycosyltransferase involved in cell wall biosynthesis